MDSDSQFTMLAGYVRDRITADMTAGKYPNLTSISLGSGASAHQITVSYRYP